jgi:putative endonuclease
MKGYWYVYILESESEAGKHYTGMAENLEARLSRHNSGQCSRTIKHRPWRIRVAIAFRSRNAAGEFEKYLKSHSGRAFAAKHF